MIILSICKVFGVSIEQLKSKVREKNIREARQMTHYLMDYFTSLTMASIGHYTNNDHSTVIHSIKVVDNDIKNDKSLDDKRNRVILEIKNQTIII